MRTPALISLLVIAALVPSVALGQPAVGRDAQRSEVQNRVSFGSDVFIGPDETVQDAVSFGGDTIVEGHVLGDAVSFGGRVDVQNGGRVDGDLTAFGGGVSGRASEPSFSPAAHAAGGHGSSFRRWLEDTARSAASHVLLFLLGVLMMAFGRERLRAMQTTMIRDGLKTSAFGLMGYVGSAVAVVVLAVTIVGVPVALLLALALPIATYIGLASAATVLGAALPIPRLKGNEIGQLAAGVAVLFLASLVPVIGTLGTIIAACLGFGALLRTRFKAELPDDLPPEGDDLGGRPLAV